MVKKYLYTDDDALQIKTEFSELIDENIIEELKQELRYFQFYIDTDHERVTTDTIFMRNFVTQIRQLQVNDPFNFNSNDMKNIISALSTSNINVCFV